MEIKADSTPDPLPEIDELFNFKEWQSLVLEAKNALTIFSNVENLVKKL